MRRLKLVVLVFLLVLCGESYANEMMDRVVTCNRVASGSLLRIQGFGGVVKWVSPKEHARVQSLVGLFKDAMYVRDDGESKELKEQWTADLMRGWKLEDSYIGAHAGQIKDHKEVLEACMHERNVMSPNVPRLASETPNLAGRGSIPWGFARVASSEGLKTEASERQTCEFRAEVLVRAAKFKGGYDSVDQMLQHYPFPDEWSDEFKVTAKADIESMYGFIGNSREYIAHFVARCKAHSEL